MNIIVPEDEEIKEITIEDAIKSNDQSKIIIKGEFQGNRGEGEEDLTKELVAHDAIALGTSRAAEIHNVPQSSASKYKDGKDIADDETRARVLSTRHNIADLATTKLMESLNLFDPTSFDKQSDLVRAAGTLANIVDKVAGRNDKGGAEVKLILYGPKQVNINQYETIDV